MSVHDTDAEVLGRILEGLPAFVLLVDRGGVIRYINRVEPGYERDQVVGMSAREVMFAESKMVFDSAFTSVLATGEPAEFEVEVEPTVPDGSSNWYRSHMVPFGVGGETDHVVIVATNVTELRAAQTEAAKLRKLLPICSWCDRIKIEDGSWTTLERYVEAAMDTRVTHGMCPECAAGGFGDDGPMARDDDVA